MLRGRTWIKSTDSPSPGSMKHWWGFNESRFRVFPASYFDWVEQWSNWWVFNWVSSAMIRGPSSCLPDLQYWREQQAGYLPSCTNSTHRKSRRLGGASGGELINACFLTTRICPSLTRLCSEHNYPTSCRLGLHAVGLPTFFFRRLCSPLQNQLQLPFTIFL